MATVKCPHCGGMVTVGTSPWTIIGWIFVLLLVLFLGTCALFMKNYADATQRDVDSTSASASAAPAYSVHVEGFECDVRESGTVARVTIRNTGSTEIPYAKAFFRFDQKIVDTYFSPSSIPPGALASADGYARSRVSCGGFTVQAQGGAPVSVAQ